MDFPFFKSLRSEECPKVEPAIGFACDELVRVWGDGAYDRATYLSWEEDFGLAPASKPGHWWRIRREIDRRSGQVTVEPQVKAAA